MKTLVVNVTETHIADGYKKNCLHCPIARAISEQLGEVVCVGNSKVYDRYDEFLAFLPETAIDFIRRFDKALTVYPFDFTIVFEGIQEENLP